MILTFFTSIVFISELILTIFIVLYLSKLSRKINDTNDYINQLKPQITEILQISKKISEQLVELTPIWVNSAKEKIKTITINQAKNLSVGILFWALDLYLTKKYDLK